MTAIRDGDSPGAFELIPTGEGIIDADARCSSLAARVIVLANASPLTEADAADDDSVVAMATVGVGAVVRTCCANRGDNKVESYSSFCVVVDLC